jgi:hypothetical protein
MLSLLAPLASTLRSADADAGNKAEHAVAGRCVESPGILLERGSTAKEWRRVSAKDEVYASDDLLALPGDRAVVEAKGGAVRLTLWAGLPARGRLQVLESAVVLNAASQPPVDLDFTLQRGAVFVTAQKEGARVRVHFKDRSWELVLGDKGTEVALELYSRWLPGTSFPRKLGSDEAPSSGLVLFVLKGEADLKVKGAQYAIQAPPGAAYFHWDSHRGEDAAPRRRDKLPYWIEGAYSDNKYRTAFEQLRQRLEGKSVVATLAEACSEDDAHVRDLAVFSLAAMDALGPVAAALADPRHADVRQAAIDALQHWIGRSTSQDARLNEYLIKQGKYSPAQAETLVQLLHGFADIDRSRPETYETLIGYLQHAKLPVRELAKHYLYSWAPAGKDIAYDPAGPASERDEAYKKWKELIPEGKLPPAPEKGK